MRNRTISIIAFAMVFIAGALFGYSFQKKPQQFQQLSPYEQALREESVQDVHMMVDFGDAVRGFDHIPAGDTSDVLDVLEYVSEHTEDMAIETNAYEGIGTLVSRIHNKQNGDGGAYWQYWVNNHYAEVATDAYAVSAGDVILWKFTNARYEHE